MTTTLALKPQPKGVFDFKSFFLIFFVILNLVYGISSLIRGLEPSVLLPIAFAAFILGWFFARSQIKTWQVLLITLVFGLLIIIVQIGGLDSYFLSNLSNLEITWPDPDFTPLLLIVIEISLRLGIIIIRFIEWLFQFVTAEGVYDLVMFNILWSFGIWFSSFWASWGIHKYNNPLIALIPSILFYTIGLDFRGANANSVLPMLGISFAFIIFITHEKITASWKDNQIRFPRTIKGYANGVAILVSLILIIVSATLPSISISKIQDFYDRIQSQRKAQAAPGFPSGPAAIQPIPVNELSIGVLEDRYYGGLPNTHLISAGPELSEQVVMIAKVDDPYASRENPTYYFRSLTYQLYTNRGWGTKATFNQVFTASQPAITQLPANQRPIVQSVEMIDVEKNSLIYSPGTLTVVDSDYRVGFRSEENQDNSNDIFGAVIAESSYQTESYLPLFGEEDLRAAGQDYPKWVKNRYLGLPDTVPDRVLTLAYELTILESNPYDRAVAIEQYLRTFPYTTDLPDPPIGKDISDHFLFTLQKGYCDYYATSMVVLARAIGLPARFAVGYIGQTYDPNLDAYVVTGDQAHSWAEIYFPEYGWIQFEPTAGRPATNRQLTVSQSLPENLASPGESFSEPRNAFEQFIQSIPPYSLLGLVVLILLTLYLTPKLDIWILNQKTPAQISSLLYQRLFRYGSWIKASPRLIDTPFEYAARLNQRLKTISKASSTPTYSETIEEQIKLITLQTVKTLYSASQPELNDKGNMILIWKQLRWNLLIAYWRMLLSRFQKPH